MCLRFPIPKEVHMATDTRQKHDRSSTEHPVQRSTGEQREIGRPTGEHRDVTRRDWDRSSYSPFAIMRQGLDEMDRWWSQLGWSRGWTSPSSGRGILSQMSQMGQQLGDWAPAIEAFQRGSDFVVRAEVPGMNRQDLNVEVGDDSLTIRGERRHEHEDDREGVFWSERSYGSFTRVIPLPPGTITDSAKASFNNGVLEVVMQAPSADARRGRRIDISGHAHEASGDKK
jgi:HSP20 family protein